MSENKHTEIIEAEIVKEEHHSESKKESKTESKSSAKKALAPLLANVILFAFGLFLLIWADEVVNVVSYAIGGLFLLYAVYNYIAFSRAEKKNYTTLIAAIGMTIAGAFLIFRAGFIQEIISFIVGIILILSSMFRLQDALKLRKINKESAKWPLILSLVCLACGVLCILGKILIQNIFLQILGVMLIIFSIADIADIIIVHKK